MPMMATTTKSSINVNPAVNDSLEPDLRLSPARDITGLDQSAGKTSLSKSRALAHLIAGSIFARRIDV
jgi:hypothetical protein